jgi:MFS family permease
MFSFGLLAVILVLHLAAAGLTEARIGLLLTLALLGDAAISLWMATRADRVGRRKMLLVGAVLMCAAGMLFAATRDFWLLLLAATIGVISPSGNEVGPFLPIEQAALAQIVPAARRTQLFAWYQLAGSLSTAAGSLAGGTLTAALQTAGFAELDSYRLVLVGYAAMAAGIACVIRFLSSAVEVQATDARLGPRNLIGLGDSSRTVLRLAGLFSLDAFAGGFVVQSIVAYWFHVRFGVGAATLGAIFFGANLLAAISALSAAWIARRIGLLKTMVFTHMPSNILLMLVPLMPNVELAVAVLLLRFSISQMDVPTRQAYTLAVVTPGERSAAAGATGFARTLGAALSPMISAPLVGIPALAAAPFLISGALKLIYDATLYVSFRHHRPDGERGLRESD